MGGLAAHFSAMARNNRWSNHVLLRACMALRPEEFTATRTSFFPSIAETLNHSLMVDRYYLDSMRQGGLGQAVFRDFTPFEDASSLADTQRGQDEALIVFCAGLTDDDVVRSVLTDRGENGEVPERIDNLLAHLFQHQIHHRGQAHAMLAGTSVEPPQLDEFFLDFERDPEIARLDLTDAPRRSA